MVKDTKLITDFWFYQLLAIFPTLAIELTGPISNFRFSLLVSIIHGDCRAHESPRSSIIKAASPTFPTRSHTRIVSGQHVAVEGTQRASRNTRQQGVEMDEGFRTEPPLSLSSFLGKVEEVLDVCDGDSDGFTGFDGPLHLGSQFGQVEQVRTIWLLGKITLKSCSCQQNVPIQMKYTFCHLKLMERSETRMHLVEAMFPLVLLQTFNPGGLCFGLMSWFLYSTGTRTLFI